MDSRPTDGSSDGEKESSQRLYIKEECVSDGHSESEKDSSQGLIIKEEEHSERYCSCVNSTQFAYCSCIYGCDCTGYCSFILALLLIVIIIETPSSRTIEDAAIARRSLTIPTTNLWAKARAAESSRDRRRIKTDPLLPHHPLALIRVLRIQCLLRTL